MTLRINKLNRVSAVNPGQVVTIDVPVNATYYGINVRLRHGAGATMASQAALESGITNMKVIVDGKTQREFTPAQLNKILAQRGVPFRNGIVPLFFAEPWRREAGAEDLLAWGTADVSSFQIEATLDDAIVSPRLDARALISNTVESMGLIVKHRQKVLQPAASGVFNYSDPNPSDALVRAHFFEQADGDINSIRAYIDRLDAYDVSDAENDAFMSHWGKHTPQTGLFSIGFDLRDRLAEVQKFRAQTAQGAMQQLVTELRAEIDTATGNPITLYEERYGVRD